jgi:hypothetical protein
VIRFRFFPFCPPVLTPSLVAVDTSRSGLEVLFFVVVDFLPGLLRTRFTGMVYDVPVLSFACA